MPAKIDTKPRVAAICLVIISIISCALAVFFPRFSCFYEMHNIENHTIEMMAGIFGCCSVFSFLSVLLWLKWPHSRGITIFNQIVIVIFVVGTSLFGISVFSIMMFASSELDKPNHDANGSSFPIKAAAKLLAPGTDLEQVWIDVQTGNSSSSSAKRDAICQLQKQFQCMMWRGSNTCVLESNESSTTTSTSSPSSTTNGSSSSSQVVPCLTCGLFSTNFTNNNADNRPISCFAAIIDCFARGREKYADSENSNSKYKYAADQYAMIVCSILILVLGLVAFLQLCCREYVESANYGEFEYGDGDYKPLRFVK
jgi:hypothetical protein